MSHFFHTTLILAQDTAPPGEVAPGNQFFGLLPFILIFVIFYFVLIRPQRKRQKELEAQVSALKIGDKVVTAGGIHGLVANIKDRTVTIKIADNTKVEFEKSAIQTVSKKKDDAEPVEPKAETAG